MGKGIRFALKMGLIPRRAYIDFECERGNWYAGSRYVLAGEQIDVGAVPARFNRLDSVRLFANNDNRTRGTHVPAQDAAQGKTPVAWSASIASDA
jgi:hypothetical protein